MPRLRVFLMGTIAVIAFFLAWISGGITAFIVLGYLFGGVTPETVKYTLLIGGGMTAVFFAIYESITHVAPSRSISPQPLSPPLILTKDSPNE